MSGCLTSVFNIINYNLNNDSKDKGVLMRFKRVENYNETDSQDAFIIDMIQPHFNYSDNDIIQFLKDNFQLSEENARKKYAEVKQSQQMMQEGNKVLKTMNNPGFLTTITQQPHTTNIIISISGINNVSYLTTLYIYIDSLIRISQSKTYDTAVATSRIQKICKDAITKKDTQTHIKDIIPTDIETIQNNEKDIIDNTTVYTKRDW